MPSTPASTVQNGQSHVDEAIVSTFASSLSGINTPESLGWTLVNYVLSEGIGQGTVNGTTIVVPVTVTVTMPPATTDRSHDIVSELCLTVLGHSLACIQLHLHGESH